MVHFLIRERYRRDNFTGNYTRRLDPQQSISFKVNVGRNDFFSSGQIPLDEVNAGTLDRFGFIDPFNGGRARTGIFSTYYKKEMTSGGMFKVDAFLGRSLLDLFSNFTFFLNDPVFGDEIQQHDSRLQEGINLQFLKPHKLFRKQALLKVGSNLHANQIQIGLFPSIERSPNRLTLNQAAGIDNPGVLQTNAHANVTNFGGYAQEAIDLLNVDCIWKQVCGGITFASASGMASTKLRLLRSCLPVWRVQLVSNRRLPPRIQFRIACADVLCQLWSRHQQSGCTRSGPTIGQP